MIYITFFAFLFLAAAFFLYSPLCRYLRVSKDYSYEASFRKAGKELHGESRKKGSGRGKSGKNSSVKKSSAGSGHVKKAFTHGHRISVSEAQEKNIGFTFFVIIMAAAFLLRVMVAFLASLKGYQGQEYDMNCFKAWAQMVYSDGFRKFYLSESFHDYPPGYMYILYVAGFIRSIFNADGNGSFFVLIIKLPAILADLGIGWIIYHTASVRFRERGAAILTALFLFCPPVFLDSAIWGQVDSVFVFFVALMIYLIFRDKMIPSYFVFAVSILIKPQALMFTPVLIAAVLDKFILHHNFKVKVFFKNLLSGLAAVAAMFILMMPYGLSRAVSQYTSTVTSYPYASVNAYNLWTFFGKNWQDQNQKLLGISYRAIGTFMIVLIVAFVIFFCIKSKSDSKYFFAAAFIAVSVFTFSVRMHERYMYPAIIFSILAFSLRPRLELYEAYVMTAVADFFNMAYVLFFYNAQKYYDVHPAMNQACFIIALVFVILSVFLITRVLHLKKGPGYVVTLAVTGLFAAYVAGGKHLSGFDGAIVSLSAPVIVTCAFMIICAIRYYVLPQSETAEASVYEASAEAAWKKDRVTDHEQTIRASVPLSKMTRRDYIYMGIITVVYAVVAFSNLGNHSAPHTDYSFVKSGPVTVDFGSEKTVSSIWDFLGYENNPKYNIQYSSDSDPDSTGSWTTLYDDSNSWDAGSVFQWNQTQVSFNARFIRISPSTGQTEDSINELVFADPEGKAITPVNKDTAQFRNLFDEQKYFTGIISYKEGTYFDEIYHARTAYEMIHKLYCYENTHPPLGKELIALGVLIFGMDPFGWRFMGTLLGVLMLPVIYNFAKKFFHDSRFACVTTLLFAFDFMHYTQTRIATIDVFVVFFIMLSYYFMYVYTQMSFYDTSLKKTFLPLTLCGITMGLGIASKWTGIYSAAGLAVIIFIQFYKRIREYIIASHSPEGETNGIKHSYIVKNFPRLMRNTVLFCCLVFLIIPAVIYVISYIPFNDGSDRTLLAKVLNAQKTMYDYHSQLKATHPYSSKWYQWPVMYRPIWYYSRVVNATMREGISAFGNPLVWWAGIPAFVYILYLGFRKKDKNAGFLVIGYLAQYAPWFLVNRVVFIYHYFPSVPFITVMVAYCLKNFCDVNPKKRKYAVWTYVAAAIILFIMFYPVITGTPVSLSYVKHFLKWSEQWVLVSG